MRLFILIFGIVLLPKAYSLKCFKCIPSSAGSCTNTENECPSPRYQCAALRIASYTGDAKLADHHMKTCVLPEQCTEDSINFGITRRVQTSTCCTTELCNSQPAPEHRRSSPNGKRCYYCDGWSCSVTLHCVGNEDHCISLTETKDGKTKVNKGCASKHMCSSTKSAQLQGAIVAEVSCCEGDFCNSASSTRAGLLLLVAPLVSLVMLS
ncbi:urokinase plasminogen activator surface receptor-like [Symphorus nematophorus]